MQTVYAYRDNGWMSEMTRWKPRRVFCTIRSDHDDEPGIEHVVKFRQGKAGTAAVISEVVCGELLTAGDVPVLDRRVVSVSESFAASYRTKTEVPYRIEEGLHFGTVLRNDVENGPPLRISDLAEPQEIVDLWVFDTWFCTTDRETEGNILLTPAAEGGFHVIAADQSDGFCGARQFGDGTWEKAFEQRGTAETVDFWQRAIYDSGGADALHAALAKADRAAKKIADAIAAVPDEWWGLAQVDRQTVHSALFGRHRRLAEILTVKRWEGLDDDTRGGILL